MKYSIKLWLSLLFVLTLILMFAGLFTGGSSLSISSVLNAIFHTASDTTVSMILFDFRIPRVLTAAAAGAALSVSGLVMQTLFRNPLAGPFVLGVESGASLGVALLVLGAGSLSIIFSNIFGEFLFAAAGFIGAFSVMAGIFLVSKRSYSNTTLLIIGLMLGYFSGAITSVLTWFSSAEQIRAFAFWNFGSFADVTWTRHAVFLPMCAAGYAVSFFSSKDLNALLLGEDYARTMGVNTQRSRIRLLAAASILAGAVTAFCGPIAFLGLAVPHLGRLILKTSDHRVLLPACASIGASMALIADFASRLPGDGKALPLNSITALLGAPAVILIVMRSRSGV